MELTPIRGLDGVKEAALTVAGKEVRVAVAHCMGNIEKVLAKVREAREKGLETPYHFIEVMACRGGCIGGGGQPTGATDEVRKARTAGIYTDDEKCVLRMSHLNPQVQKLYSDFLGKPLSEKAHHLLHNHYHAKKVYAK